MPSPLIFIHNARESELIDSAAVGADANPFALHWTAWHDLGLDDLLTDITQSRHCSWQVTTQGPKQHPGLLLQVSGDRDTPSVAILDKSQTWTQTGDRVWICTSTPPHPNGLLRHNRLRLPTHEVTLGDGLIWDVPRIRRSVVNGWVQPAADQSSELPHRVAMTRDRRIVLDPLPKYQDLWQQSLIVCHALLDQGSLSWADLLRFALDVLGLRYRFTDHLHCAFPDILTSETLFSVAKAACGFDMIEEEIQKKRHELTTAN